jgi:S1-C subfamily serine protease
MFEKQAQKSKLRFALLSYNMILLTILIFSITTMIISTFHILQQNVMAQQQAMTTTTTTSIPVQTNSNNNSNSINILTLPELYSKVEKSVVFIENFDVAGPLGSGSGFVYDHTGHIITNHHVISSGGVGVGNLDYDVTFLDGTVYSARLIGSDPLTDIAVLLVEGDVPKDKLVPLPIVNSTDVRAGEQVVAFGNPAGLKGTMTEGIVSAVGRAVTSVSNVGLAINIPDVIQTDAAINPGNSGGPLLNMKGEVIGINTQREPELQNIGYAISSNTIIKVVPTLIATGVFKHPWLGVQGIDVTSQIAKILKLEEPRGFLVVEITEGSPAAKAGIRGGTELTNIAREGRSVALGGDVILEVDDKPVRQLQDILLYLQREKEVGDNLKLTIFRDGQIQQINATLSATPGTEDIQ